jgi:prolipoprotein diacylglyceryltransferase
MGFFKLRPIMKNLEPKDFNTALVLNIIFIGIILLVIGSRGYYFLKR